jgi:hypothetical protein
MSEWGIFPFGRPNLVRPARIVGQPEAVLIGAYPNAWHVDWHPPAELAPSPCGSRVGLAVDVEPSPLWDDADFSARLALWKTEAGFIEGKHGTISPEAPAVNRSFGEKIVHSYLKPLGIAAERAVFTSIHPVYVGARKRTGRGQPDNAAAEFDSVAQRMGLLESTVPEPCPPGKLHEVAAAKFGEQLIAELTAANAPLVITLGEAAWRTLLTLPALQAISPRKNFSRLHGEDYGSRGTLLINGRKVPWLPLIQPAQLRGANLLPVEIVDKPAVETWEMSHARWARLLLGQREAARAAKRARKAKRPPAPILPEGSGYRLTITRARLVERKRLGPIVELVFAPSSDPHGGAPARGEFPISGLGLAVLISAALGEPLGSIDESLLSRLAGRELIADVVHGGTGGNSLALVRNIRPAVATAPIETSQNI